MFEKQQLEYIQEKIPNDIAVLIISDVDMHQSEVPGKYFRTRSCFSGFTGSAGTMAITTKAAALWTDFRYSIQAKQVLKDTPIDLYPAYTYFDKSLLEWIKQHAPKKSRIAIYYPSVHAMKHWQKSLPNYTCIEAAPFIDEHWKERPVHKHTKVFSYEQYNQKPRKEKLRELYQKIKENDCDHHLISTLDDIAWLLNLRALDLEHTPVFYAHLLISTKNTAKLFVNQESISPEIKAALDADSITVHPYADIQEALQAIPEEASVLIDERRISFCLYEEIKAGVVFAEQPTIAAKAVKSKAEIAGMRTIYQKEGITLVKLLLWVLNSAARGSVLKEETINKQLQMFRKQHKEYVCDSFETIVGFREHSALPHYNFRTESNTSIDGDGLLLIDTGGHYLGGSTDTTRCIYLGQQVSESIARDYTLVLKAHIALSTCRFPVGTRGIQLDAITRYPLWQQSINFGHGTGHGIGNFLEVHESPPSISPHASYPSTLNALEPGMIVSNEPGLYREGYYGIRIENILSVKNDASNEFGTFNAFDTLTLCPFDPRLIISSMCTADELDWIDTYHNHVFLELADLLDTEEHDFLAEITKPLPR